MSSSQLRYVALFLSSAWIGFMGCSSDDAAQDSPASPPRSADVDAGLDAAPRTDLPEGTKLTFALLETTDLHSNVRSFDYFKLKEDKSIGLERTATLIAQARSEFPNSILADNGDTIQGTVLADYQAVVQRVGCSSAPAIYKVMNLIGFDVAGIGNHEFNYGLDYLSQVTHSSFADGGGDAGATATCAGPAFPTILSNVFASGSDEQLFQRSAVVRKTVSVTTPDGASHETTLKVGFIAFTPPQILTWDKRWLEGKVVTKGVREVAPGLVNELRAKGCDLVVAIVHGGLDNSAYAPELENQAWHLAHLEGIDAILMGHSHDVFPSKASTSPQFNLPEVDKDRGTVAGVPAVMASFWGQHLGVMKLELTHRGPSWAVDKARTVVEARPIGTKCAAEKSVACSPEGTWRTGAPCALAASCKGKADSERGYVEPDPRIEAIVAPEHQATISYVQTPIGTTGFEMSTAFAEEGDVTAVEIVNQAQAEYVESYVKRNLPQYAALPVLSVSAPFKSGFQGGNDYTSIAAGPLAINNAADLYLYPNTVYAVKVTGTEMVDWMEMSATRFAQIDPALGSDQALINQDFKGYNFDIFTSSDLQYEIDVTKPLPAAGKKATGRVSNVTFKGQSLAADAQFLVATNNYRATGGGAFPGLDGTKTVYASPDTNRDVLITYIKDKAKALTRASHGSHRSWSFRKVRTAGRVVFTSSQNALPTAAAAGLTNISLVSHDDGNGKSLSVYAIDLSQ